ncbi:MAG: hypothetical protein COV60_03235 [Candidatus Magasanikbacteria bacterium CG11_big_fil_rev_8_21_14_0_20_43_7]|uniref:Uncharacterized protein n=1 Tax=Candidatus Magasanikbacteria bacterium CG11_big_fil_rev_8_21_14_0_20_43_7 TaxID=1974654 RepID=A0A2H0N446_9BACT|nr:MAG: hypothetical protein COV60_03235 [Candidatus Magasanikbacteria bacterium CG11_big_fil_rev_8_21_14_0_20_43_7]
MDTETPLEVRIAAALIEMEKDERWNQDVPGIKGWTYGEMIEMLNQEDGFDPERDTLDSLQEEFERKAKADLEKE